MTFGIPWRRTAGPPLAPAACYAGGRFKGLSGKWLEA